ncbi:MAG: hypothetical protein Q4E46_03780 [Candidatus Saccharibacteria bacterium]|nr:hypothetical protein [Candidatus Saccharibacteria bacterium]
MTTKTNNLSSTTAAQKAAVARTKNTTAPQAVKNTMIETRPLKKLSKPRRANKTSASNTPEEVERKKEDAREQLKHFKEVKAEAYELERQNVNKIIAFDSGEPWYKIGFKSNLIYEFYVLPHLKEAHFKPRQDSDHYTYSKTGVTSISDIIVFAEELKKRGAIIPESLEKYFDGSLPSDARPHGEERQSIYVFEFKGLTRANIDTFFKAKMKTMEDLNELVLPYYIPQELYADLHSLAQMTCDMLLRLPTAVRNVYGEILANLTVAMLRDINATCNGYGAEGSLSRVLNLILYRCAEIQEVVRILLDSNHLRFGACQVLLRLTLKVQQDAKEELAHIEKKGNPVVEAIKKAKDFPKLKGVKLDDIIGEPKAGSAGIIKTRSPQQ